MAHFVIGTLALLVFALVVLVVDRIKRIAKNDHRYHD